MTKLCLLLVLAGASLFTPVNFGQSNLFSAAPPQPSTQGDNSISHFWEKFKGAVIKGDKEAVVALSRFPISRGYGMSSLRNRAQLRKRFRELFFNETNAAQCFPKAKPVVDRERPNEFSVSCPFARDGGNEEPFIYSFTLTRVGWKFTSFENINE